MATIYRSGQPHGPGRPDWLTPYEVRHRTFSPRRRGVDTDEVSAFLHLLADQLDGLRRELTMTQRENDRLKQALREWQSAHAQPSPDPGPLGAQPPRAWQQHARRDPARTRHPNEGHW